MNNLSLKSTKRGKKQMFQYGDDTLSITELLQKPEIVNFFEKDGQLTQASRRDKLRKKLREGKINPLIGFGIHITKSISRKNRGYSIWCTKTPCKLTEEE